MLVVALTGPIGSGKSAVSSLLKKYNFKSIDSDQIVKKLQQKGSLLYEEIRSYFSDSVLAPNGELDRAKLAKLVFTDQEKKRKLEELTHPKVFAEINKTLTSYEKEGTQYVSLEIPLLYRILKDLDKSSYPFGIKAVILISAPEALRLERLVNLRKMAPEDAKRRLNEQGVTQDTFSFADYVDYVIVNDKDVASLERNVKKIIDDIKVRFRN